MRKTIHFSCKKQPFISKQDVFHVFVMIALSILFCLIPKQGFGQSIPGNLLEGFPGSDAGGFDNALLPAFAAPSAPAPASVSQGTSELFLSEAALVSPRTTDVQADMPSDTPVPAAAMTSPITARQYQRSAPSANYQQPKRLPRSSPAIPSNHPFFSYWGMPNDPQSKITGKSMTVSELLAGTRSPAARCQLLQAYWELSGLLAVYHFRCESERQAVRAGGAENMMTLLQEQRRTAELKFIKQQWILAELVKQYKGKTLQEAELPIPADYPLYPRYRTHAETIARSQKTQYLGRMIPIQEQLIESKNDAWKAASDMTQSASQPFFTALTQRSAAFLDLTKSLVEYNKMIAEYATETIPPNVNPQQFIGAVVRLPGQETVPAQSQTPQTATASQEITLSYYESPSGIPAQPATLVAYDYPIYSEDEISDEVEEHTEQDPHEQGLGEPSALHTELMRDF